MPNIDVYLEFLIEQKASDMHMSSDTPVAYRIDGEMGIYGHASAFKRRDRGACI